LWGNFSHDLRVILAKIVENLTPNFRHFETEF
jgi:hypothetical protein